MVDDSLSLLFCLFTLCCPERERVLLGGSRLPSEQLKSLLLLPPFSLPPPPPQPTTSPLDSLKKTHAHTCACQGVHRKYKPTLDWGCAFNATVTLSTNSEWVGGWASGRACVAQVETEAMVTTVTVSCMCLCVVSISLHSLRRKDEQLSSVTMMRGFTADQIWGWGAPVPTLHGS